MKFSRQLGHKQRRGITFSRKRKTCITFYKETAVVPNRKPR